MSTTKDLQKFIEKLRTERENEAKAEIEKRLEKFFQEFFIEAHKPWRAVIGNKRCKPVPIHYHISFYKDSCIDENWMWPDMPESFIREQIEKLGFVLTESPMCISVPAYNDGTVTFAQEWVKKINHSYMVYCQNEKKMAAKLYPEYIDELINTPNEKIKICDGYVLFEEFKFSKVISRKCAHFLQRIIAEDGFIFEVKKDGKYVGTGVRLK